MEEDHLETDMGEMLLDDFLESEIFDAPDAEPRTCSTHASVTSENVAVANQRNPRSKGRGKGSSVMRQFLQRRRQESDAQNANNPQQVAVLARRQHEPAPSLRAVLPYNSVSDIGSLLQKSIVQQAFQGSSLERNGGDVASLQIQLAGLHCTANAAAKIAKTQPHKVRENLFVASCVFVQAGAWSWGCLCDRLCTLFQEGVLTPVLAVRKLCFDETPTALRIAQESSVRMPEDDTQSHCKVMQSRFSLGFLVKERRTGRFHLLHGDLPVRLMSVDRTTAENTLAVLHEHMSLVPEFLRTFLHFSLRLQLCCSDRYSANFKAEAAFKSDYWNKNPQLKFTRLHTPCDLHKAATCAGTANKLVEDDTAGVLAVGLACAITGSARKIRKIIKTILLEETRFEFGLPPTGRVSDYKSEVLDMYLPIHGPMMKTAGLKNRRRRFALEFWLNGDWESDKIVHYMHYANQTSEAECRAALAHFVSWGLVSAKCPKYARGRWTGYDDALRWTGLLASCHSLLPRIFEAYCRVRKPLVPIAPTGEKDAPKTGQEIDMDDDAKLAELLPMIAVENPNQHVEDAENESSEEEIGFGASAMEWIELNRKQKANAATWTASKPRARISINLQVVVHVLVLIYKYLSIGSIKWERSEQVKAAKGQPRTYPILESARDLPLQSCMNALWSQLQLPPKGICQIDCTRQTRSLFFRSVSRLMCSLHMNLRSVHQTCPYILFKGLDTDHGFEPFLALPKCMHDEFAARITSMFSTKEDLSSPECLALPRSVARLAPVDIGDIEASHAKNRDVSKLRASGWVPTLQFLSAKHVSRKVGQMHENLRGKEGDGEATSDGKQSKAKKKNKRPGGAWRAFIHEGMKRWPGKTFTAEIMQQLSQEYRALSDQEMQFYDDMGRLATAAGRAGHKPFGAALPSLPEGLPGLGLGTENASGAMILADERSVGSAMLRAPQGTPYDEQLRIFMLAQPKRQKRGTQAEQEVIDNTALAEFRANVGKISIQKQLELPSVRGMSGMSNTFVTDNLHSVPGTPDLFESLWEPPVVNLAEARWASRRQQMQLGCTKLFTKLTKLSRKIIQTDFVHVSLGCLRLT